MVCISAFMASGRIYRIMEEWSVECNDSTCNPDGGLHLDIINQSMQKLDLEYISTCVLIKYIPSLGYLNPFKPEFTIIIFIHYKPRIAVAILDL